MPQYSQLSVLEGFSMRPGPNGFSQAQYHGCVGPIILGVGLLRLRMRALRYSRNALSRLMAASMVKIVTGCIS